MAITDAQQAKQIMMQDGGVPQLVKRGKGKKRPGYRGEGGYQGGRGGGYGAGRSDSGSKGGGYSGGGGGGRDASTKSFDKSLNPNRPGGPIGRDDPPSRPPQEIIGGKSFDVTSDPKNIEQRNFARSIAADAKRVADRKKKQKDLTFIENFLSPAGYTRRTKASNLKDLDLLDRKIGNIPTFATGIIDAFNVPKETALFDIDSIREIYSPLSTMAGKKGLKQSQLDTLSDLREDMEIEQKILDGTLTNKEFLDYRDRNKKPDTGGRDDAQSNPCLGPNPPAYCFIGDNAPKEEEEEPFKMALAFRADGGRVPYEDGGYTGGIMDLETGRQMYFLGKLVKKAGRAVKKIVKSPVGKIGLAALAFSPLAGAGLAKVGQAGGFGKFFSGLGKKFGLEALSGKLGGGLGLSLAGGALAGLLQKGQVEDEDGDGFDDNTGLDISKIREDYISNRSRAFRKEGGMSDVENDPQYKGWKRIYEVNPEAAEMHPKHKEFVKYYANVERQGKEEGGLMDLKGMEMDFRDEGGFVPIGKKERADDVPARLSKNEFVMTADAVRGAGDGNIDKGAEKMYNLMSKLEAENDQSQGLDGARKMFKTAQRLEEVL